MKGQRQDNPTKGTKGNKRKWKDEPGVAEPKKHARSVSAPQKASTALHAQPTEVLSGFQRMDEETTTYLNEVKAHLDTLDDREEISLLVSLQPMACQWTCHPCQALRCKSKKQLPCATDCLCFLRLASG